MSNRGRILRRREQGIVLGIRLGVLLGICWVATGWGGCATPQAERFRPAVWNYYDALRWGDYHKAGAFVAKEYRGDFRKKADRLERSRLRIVDFDIVEVRVDDSGNSGESLVTLEYYWEKKGVVRRLLQKDRWVLEKKQWRLVPALEAFSP